MYYKISLIEVPKLVFMKQKKMKEKTMMGGRIIFRLTVYDEQFYHGELLMPFCKIKKEN